MTFTQQLEAHLEQIDLDGDGDVDLIRRLAAMTPDELATEEQAAFGQVARGLHIHATIGALRRRRAN